MKPTTAISLLALAYATAVTAIPTPDAPGVYAVPADSDSGNIEARDPMMWGPKKVFLGENGYKRDVSKQDGPGQGHGFGQGNQADHPKPQGMPAGAPHGMPEGPQGGPKNVPFGGAQGGNPFDGKHKQQ